MFTLNKTAIQMGLQKWDFSIHTKRSKWPIQIEFWVQKLKINKMNKNKMN